MNEVIVTVSEECVFEIFGCAGVEKYDLLRCVCRIILLLIALSRRRRKAIRVSFACAIPQRI